MDAKVSPAPRYRPPDAPVDPEVAGCRSNGGRRMERYGDGYAARFGDHSPYTKGNFEFERVVRGWRSSVSVLDLRLKRQYVYGKWHDRPERTRPGG